MHVRLIRDGSDWRVEVNGEPLDPARSQAVFNHSPDGFSWGYSGSGPTQLALALLLHAGVPDDDAFRMRCDFRDAVLAGLRSDLPEQNVSIDVAAWITRRGDAS